MRYNTRTKEIISALKQVLENCKIIANNEIKVVFLYNKILYSFHVIFMGFSLS